MGLLPTGTGDWLAFETRGSVRLLAILQPFSLLTHSLLQAPRNFSAVNFTTYGIRLYYHVHLFVQFQSSATMSLRLPPVCLSVNQTYRHFYYETDVLEISPD